METTPTMTDMPIRTEIMDGYRAYSGVRTRRIFAFLIDYVTVGILLVPAAVLLVLFGLLTLGFGFVLFAVFIPLVALTYIFLTLGGPHQATWGMRVMDIHLVRLDGGTIDGLTAVVHTVLFWAGNTLLSPFILLVALFTRRKQTLHDLLLGTTVERTY